MKLNRLEITLGITPSGAYYPLCKDIKLFDKIPVNTFILGKHQGF